ncbi:MAG: acetate--CoA ligase family protein [Burkholderiales bacterium]|nr:acetate--CoA ligase family protein [Burkholderiales bacterium]
MKRDLYTSRELGRMLAPRSIAVVGASETAGNFGRRSIENLRDYAGTVHAVNPKYESIAGRPCVERLSQREQAPDCVVIAVPRERVEPIAEEAAALGVGGIIIYASGYAETGLAARAAEQERLAAIGRAAGVPIIGPNCIGIINHGLRCGLTFMPHYPDVPAITGHTAIVSQSGAMGYIFVQSPMRGVGFTHYLASGNSCDVDVCDLASYLVDVPEVKSIGFLFEGLRDGARLLRLGERARAAGKNIIAYKMTAGEASKRAALSHTGSLAGTDEAYRAAARKAGLVIVDDMETVLETALFFAKAPPPSGKGPAVLVGSGGAGVIAAAKAEASGLTLPQPSERVQALLAREVPDFGSTANPCDVTAQVLNSMESFARCMSAFLDEPDFDALVFPVAYAHPELTLARYRQVTEFAKRYPGKMLCASWFPVWLEGPGSREYETDERIALFRSTAHCMHALAEWHERARRAAWPAAPRATARAALQLAPGTMTERDSKAALAAYGIRVTREALASDFAAAASAAAQIGYPVAVKIESPDIPHKTEAGVVRLGIRDADELRRAYDEIVAAAGRVEPKPRVAGVLVCEMVSRGVEIVVGAKVDPQFGPLVTVGMGGVLVELLKDVQVGLAPVTPTEARDMIDRLKARKLLDGYRGAPPAHVEALVDMVVRLSELIADHADRISEIDVNPVLLGPDGGVAVDALIVVDR